MSAIIVTRGDVDLDPIWASVPDEWEKITWDNSGRLEIVSPVRPGYLRTGPPTDLSVYGRYAAIQYASHPLVYVQDDDCVVSDPQQIVDVWDEMETLARIEQSPDSTNFLVANMPQEFRPHYLDSCLVGFGACFHRDAPARAFQAYVDFYPVPVGLVAPKRWQDGIDDEAALLHRTCDVVFTTLTPRVLVDVPVEVLPYAHDENRMWKQPDHFGERTQVLEMARKVRDE